MKAKVAFRRVHERMITGPGMKGLHFSVLCFIQRILYSAKDRSFASDQPLSRVPGRHPLLPHVLPVRLHQSSGKRLDILIPPLLQQLHHVGPPPRHAGIVRRIPPSGKDGGIRLS